MAFRTPLCLALLLASACYEQGADRSDTAPPSPVDPDTDAGMDTANDLELATPEGLCGAVFALCEDAWGWPDPESCAERWLGQDESWECGDIPSYLACAAPCLEAASCDAFGACEVPCWDAWCL